MAQPIETIVSTWVHPYFSEYQYYTQMLGFSNDPYTSEYPADNIDSNGNLITFHKAYMLKTYNFWQRDLNISDVSSNLDIGRSISSANASQNRPYQIRDAERQTDIPTFQAAYKAETSSMHRATQDGTSIQSDDTIGGVILGGYSNVALLCPRIKWNTNDSKTTTRIETVIDNREIYLTQIVFQFSKQNHCVRLLDIDFSNITSEHVTLTDNGKKDSVITFRFNGVDSVVKETFNPPMRLGQVLTRNLTWNIVRLLYWPDYGCNEHGMFEGSYNFEILPSLNPTYYVDTATAGSYPDGKQVPAQERSYRHKAKGELIEVEWMASVV
jgi:hypothetical protein